MTMRWILLFLLNIALTFATTDERKLILVQSIWGSSRLPSKIVNKRESEFGKKALEEYEEWQKQRHRNVFGLGRFLGDRYGRQWRWIDLDNVLDDELMHLATHADNTILNARLNRNGFFARPTMSDDAYFSTFGWNNFDETNYNGIYALSKDNTGVKLLPIQTYVKKPNHFHPFADNIVLQKIRSKWDNFMGDMSFEEFDANRKERKKNFEKRRKSAKERRKDKRKRKEYEKERREEREERRRKNRERWWGRTGFEPDYGLSSMDRYLADMQDMDDYFASSKYFNDNWDSIWRDDWTNNWRKKRDAVASEQIKDAKNISVENYLNNEVLSRIRGNVLIRQMIDLMLEKRGSVEYSLKVPEKITKAKYIGHSNHDWNLHSLLKTLGIEDIPKKEDPRYPGCLVIELWRNDEGDYEIDVLYRFGANNTSLKKVSIDGCEDSNAPCLLDEVDEHYFMHGSIADVAEVKSGAMRLTAHYRNVLSLLIQVVLGIVWILAFSHNLS